MSESEKYICDFMLGRLARWMRLIGIDTEYYNNPEGPGLLHRALKEGRMIITRSREFEKNENSIIIDSEILDEQLKELKGKIPVENIFTRCVDCNIKLEEVNKKDIKDEVPEYIYKVHEEFRRCPSCGKIFWKGTHYREIERKINEIFK